MSLECKITVIAARFDINKWDLTEEDEYSPIMISIGSNNEEAKSQFYRDFILRYAHVGNRHPSDQMQQHFLRLIKDDPNEQSKQIFTNLTNEARYQAALRYTASSNFNLQTMQSFYELVTRLIAEEYEYYPPIVKHAYERGSFSTEFGSINDKHVIIAENFHEKVTDRQEQEAITLKVVNYADHDSAILKTKASIIDKLIDTIGDYLRKDEDTITHFYELNEQYKAQSQYNSIESFIRSLLTSSYWINYIFDSFVSNNHIIEGCITKKIVQLSFKSQMSNKD